MDTPFLRVNVVGFFDFFRDKKHTSPDEIRARIVEIREEIRSTVDGHVMAMRDHPVVYPGSMVARVVVA